MEAVMKQFNIYVLTIWKRMWRTPGYLIIFFLVPAVLVLLSCMTEKETAQIMAAVYLEAPDEGGMEGTGNKKEGAVLIEKIADRLSKREGALRFLFCASEEEVRAQVASGRAQCGYVLSETLFGRLEEGRYTRSIKSYRSPASSQHTVCDEVLFAEIFSVYEEMTFGEQVSDFFFFSQKSGEEDAAGKETGERKAKEIKERADRLFEKYLYNGSTFQFTYETYSGNDEKGTEGMQGKADRAERTETAEKNGIVPVRGIMAFMVYICSLCATLESIEDEEAGRTLRLRRKRLFQVLTIWIPTFFMNLMALAVFAVAGSLDGFGSIGDELLKLLWYPVVMTLYGCMVKQIWRSEESFLAAMPVLILSAAVVCPVFIDLSMFLPVLKVLEKFYPLSYYLRW